MREIQSDKYFTYGAFLLILIGTIPLFSALPRTKGKNPVYHVCFLLSVAALLFFLPEWIQDEIFSPGGVVVIGTVLPVYESIKAVCTVGAEDDTAWLQFWIASGTLNYVTEWVDSIRHYFPQGGEHWYEFEFFIVLWMMFPLTDGAALIHEKITAPYISPYAKQISSKVEGWIALILTVVNTSHLYMAWFLFMTFPEEQRRFFVVAAGTVYPLAASIISIVSIQKRESTTFWLTYWACFSLLFLAMDYLENFVGGIPGFYSLCLVATMYLFLPMFDGASVIFRRILVPLSGQQESLCLYDAHVVRKNMEMSIPESAREKVFKKAASVFVSGKTD